MSRSVLMSINPKWCELIAHGLKTVEVRKTRPKLETPFKVYIYCAKPKTKNPHEILEIHGSDGKIRKANGEVIGEFVCDWIRCEVEVSDGLVDVVLESTSCVSAEKLVSYSNGMPLYSWHISDLVIYDKPKELSEFTGLRKTKFGYEPIKIARPPQSWCYVEEVRA